MNFEKNIFHPNFHKSGKDNLIQENNRLNIALYIFFFLKFISRRHFKVRDVIWSPRNQRSSSVFTTEG